MVDSMELWVDGNRTQADGVEFDVRHTRDGIPILMHDQNLKRTAESKPGKRCPIKKKVSSLTFAEIQENCQLKYSPEQAERLSRLLPAETDQQKLREIPTLDQALSLLAQSDLKAFVEFKDRPHPTTLEVLERNYKTRPDNLRIISFWNRHLRSMREKKNENDPFWQEVDFLLLSPFSPSHIASKLFPRRKQDDGVSIRHQSFSEKHFGEFHKEVSVWTVNSFIQLSEFFERPVHFITTGNIEECLRVQHQHSGIYRTPDKSAQQWLNDFISTQ
jgi:glycerophosphoryl diester phosphodiesterase